MKEPWFWRKKTLAARAAQIALAPASFAYDAGQRLRSAFARAIDPSASVICVGNASVGGTGKTPFCLMLQRLLTAEGIEAQFLTRGYRGALAGPVAVDARHTAEDTGDEALLLAAAAPTWVAKNRAAGAIAAAKGGATLLIMDDGFQNPTVRKTLSLLIIGGDEGSLAQFPAGPMREPLWRAIKRADALVLAEREGSAPRDPAKAPTPPLSTAGKPAFCVSSAISASIAPQRVAAFCGIGRPERFFDDLERKGFTLAARAAFPDHHRFTAPELLALRARAKAADAGLITTEKDFVRLAPADRAGVAVARLTMRAGDPAALVRFVRERIAR